ncbi:MAG: PEP-CTERM sorting domain-containing protein [Leptolyngbya sp. SIOISBB]|nr:PEP-CTERM sorting domain-containing protein [Leptolyngbya sp. SIOISBB]
MFKQTMIGLVGAAALGMGFVSSAEAVSFVSTTGLADADQTITFDEFVFDPGTPITNEYSSLGVEFSPTVFYSPQPSSAPGIQGNSIGNFFFTNQNPFSILFNDIQSAAVFGFATNSGNTTFTALLDSVVVESFSNATDLVSPTAFFGFTDILFDEIQIEIAANSGLDFGLLDNLQTKAPSQSVPEPASMLGLLTIGAVAAGGALKKKASA